MLEVAGTDAIIAESISVFTRCGAVVGLLAGTPDICGTELESVGTTISGSGA